MAKREIKLTILGDASHVSRMFGKTATEAQGFGSKIQGHVGSAMAGVGSAVAIGGAALGVGLVAGFAKAIHSAADFQTSLSVFSATANMTGATMDQVRAKAIALGNDVKLPGTSAKDAADAMVELAKGGLTAKEAMDAATGTLQMSAAAQISNADAATMVADNLNAFALAGKDAAMVADLLASAANATTASMPEMGDALKQSAAVAHNLGIPINETVAALGELANKGIKGSDAGTSLKTMLMSLSPSSKKASGVISELGVSAFDQSGKFIGLRATIQKYHAALAPMSDEQRQNTLQTIFGSDATRAAAIIMGDGAKGFDKMTTAVGQTGAAQKLAASQTTGFNGAMGGFQSTLETIAIELGTKMLPAATKVMNWLTNELPVAVKVAGDAVASASAYIHAHWAEIQAATQGVIMWYRANVAPTIDAVAGYIRAILAGLSAFWDRWGANIIGIVKAQFGVLRGIVTAILALIRGDWGAAWDAVKSILQNELAVIRGILGLAISLIGALAKKIGEAIVDKIEEGVGNLEKAIRGKISDLKDGLVAGVKSVAGDAKDLGAAVLSGIKDGIGDIGAWIVGKLRSAVNGAITALNNALHIRFSVDTHIPGVGTRSVDFNPPDIPHLGAGGVTNGPMLAVIGDNPSGREAVVPLDKYGLGGGGGTVIEVHVAGSVVTERDITRSILESIKTAARQGTVVIPASAVRG